MMIRTGFVGGSDVAAVIGVSPWKTPYALFEEKIGAAVEDSTHEDRKKVLRRGKRLEPVVMEMLQEEHDLNIGERNAIHIDPEYEWMRAEIDFEYFFDEGLGRDLLEVGNGDVKTVSSYARSGWGEEGSDEVPSYYAAQFLWGQMITGRSITMVAALFDATDLRIYYVPRNEELIAFLRTAAINFWTNHVLTGVAPPIRTAEDAARVVAKFDGLTVQADDTTRKALDRLKGIKAAEKRLEAKREEYEFAVKKAFATQAGDETPGKFALVDEAGMPLASWNLQSCKRVDVTMAKRDFPEFAAACTRESTFRVLRCCK